MAKKSEPFHKKPKTPSAQTFSRSTWPIMRKLQIQELINEELQKMKEDRELNRTYKKVLDLRSEYPDVPRFTVRKFNAVALWSWDMDMETCAICRNHLMDECILCQARDAQDEPPPNGCTVAWGTCNHAFHLHCIATWLNTREVCPLDNKVWEFKRYGI
ncbi:RING-box protein pip1-like [Diaphorina citri]|uniref:RING-box protein pip1-like n=1 Tax=Diaphorina citri TaxID=121845 RepID=A0A1S3DUZ9_DIACI|nr:RING-box protein pip1-like [Diaphorina citri]XP_026675953.1 RING-box protein pip1-like [Diaphorina citri]KAI5709692.1 hypothetical protein M8J75_002408 [Diaphorina citri]KAI5745658.1 hypothetical protein M8J76_013172 [Diaphorina citri]KAI5753259.1 hypothetical protein M8J77_025209 [Diaphorina citri]